MGGNIDRYKFERDERWRESVHQIPWLAFPSSWEVKIIPPFAGAGARFLLRRRGVDGDEKAHRVSVYLDLVEALGFYGGEPYWEIYPYDGDTFRCAMSEGDELMAALKHAMRTRAGSQ